MHTPQATIRHNTPPKKTFCFPLRYQSNFYSPYICMDRLFRFNVCSQKTVVHLSAVSSNRSYIIFYNYIFSRSLVQLIPLLFNTSDCPEIFFDSQLTFTRNVYDVTIALSSPICCGAMLSVICTSPKYEDGGCAADPSDRVPVAGLLSCAHQNQTIDSREGGKRDGKKRER